MNEINKEERMQGLSGQQVSESKAKYGTNELAKKERIDSISSIRESSSTWNLREMM